MAEKVVLAYSGGLDTTVAVCWLRETMGLEVVAATVDAGQGQDLEAIRERALKSGAVQAHVVGAADEFASDFVAPALKANAAYQQKYPLFTALSRPLIARHLARVAREVGARYVAHGCSGKGNDQVRFEVSLGVLAPELEVLAPVRDWGMTRDESVTYGLKRGLAVPGGASAPYSIDQNLWGRSIECGALEDPMVEPPEDVWETTVDPVHAPREPTYLEIGFAHGVPVSVDGEVLALRPLIARIEQAAGSYGVGRVDMIEDRVVGIKSREIYEIPASATLLRAHADLEELTLDREVLRTKRVLEQRYAQLVYEGYWYSPLREALDAFCDSTQHDVNGTVRLRLEPGAARVVGRSSEGSLYDLALATYERGDAFDHTAGAGFIKLWGLALKSWSRARRRG